MRALALGLLGAPAGGAWGQLLGRRPAQMPPDQSIYRLSGDVRVNGAPATLQTRVRPGDTVETGEGAEVIFVLGGHSMILRGRSSLLIEPQPERPGSLLAAGLRLLAGALLSVSRNQRMRLRTANATIGIRGTGWYAEAQPELTYFCTCYGIAEIAAAADPASSQTVEAKQHDRPLYVASGAPLGGAIRNAPFINHTDQELALIEALVGRTPPFVLPADQYRGPRRGYR